jgi:hypothetical protein
VKNKESPKAQKAEAAAKADQAADKMVIHLKKHMRLAHRRTNFSLD